MTAAPTFFPTATVPIATQMVHGTKTFEILGTASVHQEAAAEIVECFRHRSASSRPPRFVTAPVLEAPSAVVEYVEFAHRCGVRDARTSGHVHTCCSWCRVCDVATLTAAPTVFPIATVPIVTATCLLATYGALPSTYGAVPFVVKFQS